MTPTQAQFLDHDGVPIAYRLHAGKTPGLVWLGGFRSDMLGTKAEALDEWASQSGHAFLRHDYSGHGESGGAFRDGAISRWTDESLAVFRAFTAGPQILIGSSMGAWIALRMARTLNTSGARNVAGLILLAPAPDFTSDLIEPKLSKRQKKELATNGFIERPSEYGGEPYLYTRTLIEDGERCRVLTGPIDTHCPVHIIQGLADPDVPHTHALKLASHLPADDVTLSLIPDGDHRLSRPQDIAMLRSAVEAMVTRIG